MEPETSPDSHPLAAALRALMPVVEPLTAPAEVRAVLPEGIERGYFRPAEEAELLRWFAQFLTVREALWEVVGEASAGVEGEVRRIAETEDWRSFVLGYSAACLIVRLDFFLVLDLAAHRLVQRKLNEGAPEFRIPRKQFTRVFRSLADPRKALAMVQAMRWAKEHRGQLATLAEDAEIGFVVRQMESLEGALNPSKRAYVQRLLGYREHSFRRRGASGRDQMLLAVLEASGRAVAEVRNHWRAGRVGPDLRQQLLDLLEPGDVVITRREQVLSNLLLPGYWPHAALYIGSEADRERLGVRVDAERARRWTGDVRFLEALKDGVRFRPGSETLAVDAVAVIRPRLAPEETAEAIARAVAHEGKLYNFDFDFFRSDRLVCTEVVYRGFDGIGGIHLQLRSRSGRPTLAAEDLLNVALEGSLFQPIAVCGAETCPHRMVCGEEAVAALRRSLDDHRP